MTTGKARVLETDAIMFSTEVKQNDFQEIPNEQPLKGVKLAEGTKAADMGARFARLKKSLRKRSASIL